MPAASPRPCFPPTPGPGGPPRKAEGSSDRSAAAPMPPSRPSSHAMRRRQLAGIHPAVGAAVDQQLRRRALLDHAAPIQNDDAIERMEGGKAMGDGNHGTSLE